MVGNRLVTVIIPTYKRPENLLRAIESVQAQTYKSIEIIVVDDNGEGTEWQKYTSGLLVSLIENKAVTYIVHERNKNGSAARNTGFKASNGEYVNFLDDDDIFEPTKIEKQMECLLQHADEYGACICNTRILGRKRRYSTTNTKEGNLLQEVLTEKVEFNTSAVLFRREVLDYLHGFDESFFRHQDWELFVRFFRRYKVCLVKDILLKKISTPNILTKNPLKAIEYKEKFLRAFEKDFQKMSKCKRIYKCQYEMLALGLLFGGYKCKAFHYIKVAARYGLPSFWVFVKYVYYIIEWWKKRPVKG